MKRRIKLRGHFSSTTPAFLFPPSSTSLTHSSENHGYVLQPCSLCWSRQQHNRYKLTYHPVGFIPLVGIGAGIIGATVLTPLLTGPILGVVGFSAAGPVAGKGRFLLYDSAVISGTASFFCCRTLGTLAAGIQSSIGNVAAGSLFATVQGAAMGAGIPALAQVIGGAVTGVVGLAVAAIL